MHCSDYQDANSYANYAHQYNIIHLSCQMVFIFHTKFIYCCHIITCQHHVFKYLSAFLNHLLIKAAESAETSKKCE